MTIARVAVVLLLYFTASPSLAAIESFTDPAFPGGADNITRDTATGLEWLDWTATTGRPFDEINGLLGAGQEFAGWRYATEAELGTFLTNLGLPTDNFPGSSFVTDNGAAFSAAVDWIGQTSRRETVAYYAETAVPDSIRETVNLEIIIDQTTVDLGGVADNGMAGFDTGSNGIGHALVRNGVFEPGTGSVPEAASSLVWLGLLGAAAVKRR